MKRDTPLRRKAPLARSGPLRRRRRKPLNEQGRVAWKNPVAGWCECGCGKFALRLHRHHVVTEQQVRREGGDPWALVNSMLLHERCHMNHHAAFRRVPFESVPAAAVDFARRLLGVARADMYFARTYGVRPGERQARVKGQP